MFLNKRVTETLAHFACNIVFAILQFSFLLGASSFAIAQSERSQSCSYISSNVANKLPIDLSSFVVDKASIECLTSELKHLEHFVKTANVEKNVDDGIRYKMITGALVAALNDQEVDAISLIREVDDVDFASILAFGASNSDKYVRVNSSRILASVVDNTTLCVVVDHLHSPVTESSSDNPTINGRANLLAIASVAAPWARTENYEALLETKNKIIKKIDGLEKDEKENLDNTRSIIDRLDRRLNLQNLALDNSVKPPKDFSANTLLNGCKSYSFINPDAKMLYPTIK